MKIVLLGAQGCGKGTQAKLICSKYNIPQISTGDMLRSYASQDTDFGREIKATIDAGKLVSDEIILAMLKDRIAQPDCANGFILDGVPRTLSQAEAIAKFVEIDKAVLIEVDPDKLIRRLTGRLTCNKCGNISHIDWVKGKVCEKCGGEYTVRADDADESAIRARLSTYSEKTMPVVDYYRAQDKLRVVEGAEEVQDTFARMVEALEK
ncbi:MAG: adenylate kinase [Clostridia bacterium]